LIRRTATVVAVATVLVVGALAPAAAQGGTTNTTGNRSTPAGSPPSLGEPESVSREDAGNTTGGGVHSTGQSDDGSDVPWVLIVVVVGAAAIGAGVLIVWRRSRREDVGST
jgi:hypothetical protein